MKTIRLLMLVLVMIIASQCSPAKIVSVSTQATESSTEAEDEETYDLVIMDTRFNSWLATQPSIDMYTYAYLRSKNLMFVAEYNTRVHNNQRYGIDLYPQTIDYHANVEYDKDLQYKLYNYFIYFQKKFNQRLN